MNSRILAFVAVFCIVAGHAMGDPVAQPEPTGQAGSPPDNPVKTQPELTPSQLVARDFQTMAQDHATVGVANSRKKDPQPPQSQPQ